MTSDLSAIRFRADDPHGLARFWAGLLDWRLETYDDGTAAAVPGDDRGWILRFEPGAPERVAPNRYHLDLTSTSEADRDARVARVLELGGRHLDVGQGPDETHVVLADPEGNAVDVIDPGNRFLAGCGLVGAVNGDGSQAVGRFWSAALGWPLVWDQDEETAIQAPSGGAKIAWGGPPVAPQRGPNRLYLEISPRGDVDAEVARLVALGATRLVLDPATGGEVLLADPDGTEFAVAG